MRLRVVTVDVVQVVGRAQAQAELLPEPRQDVVHLDLLVDSVALDLEQESVLAEDVAIHGDRLTRALDVPVYDAAGRLALQAARKRDQAFRVLGQDLLVDARPVVHPLHLADRAEPHEVDVALVVGGEEGEVVGVAVDASLTKEARAGRNVDLAADDRLDPCVFARLVEVNRAVHDAVVGETDRGHLELGGAGDHRWDPAGAIEQRILGVIVEVDEGFRGVRHRLDWVWRTPRIV